MTKRDLIDFLESRADIPDDAELRVTVPLDPEACVNQPAVDVRYTELGPLHYIEVV